MQVWILSGDTLGPGTTASTQYELWVRKHCNIGLHSAAESGLSGLSFESEDDMSCSCRLLGGISLSGDTSRGCVLDQNSTNIVSPSRVKRLRTVGMYALATQHNLPTQEGKKQLIGDNWSANDRVCCV